MPTAHAPHDTQELRILASRKFGTRSPLRYPGGKAALAGLIADVISHLKTPTTLVEPYAGGAGVGVALLLEGKIDRLEINDLDPAVYAFWHSVTHETPRLIELTQTAPLTIEYWREQRTIYQSRNTSDTLKLGFAAFYLNRTNRSGILGAGAIGGQRQQGHYTLGARFNRETLSQRIGDLGDLADRIAVTNRNGADVVNDHSDTPASFIFIDPPYIGAGPSLYRESFTTEDHAHLASCTQRLGSTPWLTTYDRAPDIERLYHFAHRFPLDITYSAHKPGAATEVIIAPPLVAGVVVARDKTQPAGASANPLIRSI